MPGKEEKDFRNKFDEVFSEEEEEEEKRKKFQKRSKKRK